MSVVAGAVALFMLVAYLAGLVHLTEVYDRTPKLDGFERSPLLQPGPLLSVVVPARDEEANICRCLESVLRQRYLNLEVIVVNDNSSDRTGELARTFAGEDPRLTVLDGAPLPPGWSGRVYACLQGAKRARGTYLLILDADTELVEDGLGRALAYALEHQTDLLAVLPRTEVGPLWENLIQSMMGHLFLLQFDAQRLHDPDDPQGMAWGGFLLFRRSAYDQIGGHEGMRGAVVDGPQLAQKLKRAGLRLGYVHGQNVVLARMHSAFRSVWNGWTRGIYLGLERSVARGLLLIALLLGFLIMPWALFWGGLLWSALHGFTNAGPEVVLTLLWGGVGIAAMTHQVVIRELFGMDFRYRWLQPLGALLVVGIVCNSIWRVVFRRQVSWRGRVYPTTG